MAKNIINDILSRGVEEVIDKNHLLKKLQSGKKLRIKLGVDPTSPNLHLGRAVTLLKLRDFQILGHQAVFIIGDFTALIGDSSDKEAERTVLTRKAVDQNLKTYLQQVSKILDLDKTEVVYNAQWLNKLKFTDIIKQSSAFTLAEFIARKNIRERLTAEKRISLRELLYPLMQGYDSVRVKADVELGGTDQRFNLLAGRTLQTLYQQEPQDFITTKLIVGLDGRKMSSSWSNTINLMDSPGQMFGKVMSLPDDLMIDYFTLCTRVDLNLINQYQADLQVQKVNPRDIKAKLAFEIVKLYYADAVAQKAAVEFDRVFKEKAWPDDLKTVKVKSNLIIEILIETQLVSSRAEAQRLINQGGVYINHQPVSDWRQQIDLSHETVIQVGKRKFVKIKK